jgi:hypothetical protein
MTTRPDDAATPSNLESTASGPESTITAAVEAPVVKAQPMGVSVSSPNMFG